VYMRVFEKTHAYANRHLFVYAHTIIRHETTTHAK